jgi:DTW domain-containing protein YfiP
VVPKSAVSEPVYRTVCGRCRRPEKVCYCAALPRLETRTKVVILQHPRERDMPIGTARMASLCLPSAELHVGRHWDGHVGLQAALTDAERPPILLYPGEGAKNILAEPPRGPVTLVVVDGTWSQAKTLVRDSPVLRALPRYAFAAPEPSNYRIRPEPSDEYTSTIEALMHVLGALEGEPERFRALMAPLNAMVDAQLAAQASSPSRRSARKKKAHPKSYFLPPELARWDDLVVVAAEGNTWPYSAAQRGEPELIHFVARRIVGGETFDRLCAPRAALLENTAFHAQLDERTILAAPPARELVDAFMAWLRPTDLLCSWGHNGPNLLAAAGATIAPGLDVRTATHRLSRDKVGCLESYAESFAAPWEPRGSGRAGKRVGMIEMILGEWRKLL